MLEREPVGIIPQESRCNILPVRTELVKVNPEADVQKWIKDVFGSVEAFQKFVSFQVYGGSSNRQAECYPSGGRSVILKLPPENPYIDPVTRQSCHELDVKGCLLTPNGYAVHFLYLANSTEIEKVDRRYLEVMYNWISKELFGPNLLENCLQAFSDLQLVRQVGFPAPIPLAVLRFDSIVVDGNKTSAEECLRQFRLPAEQEFGILVRLWPKTARRLIDFLQFPKALKACRLPFLLDLGDEKFSQKAVDVLKIMREHYRSMFLSFRNPDEAKLFWYQYMEKVTDCLLMMHEKGLSPITSWSNKDHLNHAHLQNITSTSDPLVVEWTPLQKHSETEITDFKYLLQDLSNFVHGAVVGMGSLVLNDFDPIPKYSEYCRFIEKCCDSWGKKLIYDFYLYHAHLFASSDKGEADFYVWWLKKNQEKLLRPAGCS